MRGVTGGLTFGNSWLFLVVALAIPVPVLAQAAPANDGTLPVTEAPVFHVRFEGGRDGQVLAEGGRSESKALAPGRVVGVVTFDAPGPRPEKFPRFEPSNSAAKFGANGSIRFADSGENSPLDIGLGDSITLEAWVAPTKLGNGQNMYVVGKGRTKNEGFAAENQNYALRLAGDNGQACVSFLFRNARNRKGQQDDFHRWTTTDGFKADGSWHHVAVTYTFGKSDSVKGYIDGKPLVGKWDYGGATNDGPVVDNDELWIGSALGGSAGNTFDGLLDEIAIHRAVLSAEILKSRYVVKLPPSYVTQPPDTHDLIFCEIMENIPDQYSWDFPIPTPSLAYIESSFGLTAIPHKYNSHGVREDRSNPLMVRLTGWYEFPQAETRLILRSHCGARLFIDGKLVAQNPFPKPRGDADDLYDVTSTVVPGIRVPRTGDYDKLFTVQGNGQKQVVTLEVFAGGKKHRPEFGETGLWIERAEGQFHLVSSPGVEVPLTDAGWLEFARDKQSEMESSNKLFRRSESIEYAKYWRQRHDRAAMHVRLWKPVSNIQSPADMPVGNRVDHFINAKLASVNIAPQPLVDDWAFLRRVSLDVIGTLPPKWIANEFLPVPSPQPVFEEKNTAGERARVRGPNGDDAPQNKTDSKQDSPNTGVPTNSKAPLTLSLSPADGGEGTRREDSQQARRAKLIDRLLDQPGWADHWIGYWQDVLAENPNIVNPTLNNTGPFRWWLQESFSDNKPFDRFATELILMEGSTHYGGPAGFGIASQNDSPMAAKAHVLAQAFLGMEMKCARCHDAPYHDFTQRDLFSLAAMLKRGDEKVPKTSTIPGDEASIASLLVKVTLKPGEAVSPIWPFAKELTAKFADDILFNPQDQREQLAALVTAPTNRRFAQVIVNRMWHRYLGRGLVEPIDDWEHAAPSHRELLEHLERELIRSGYDLKHVARLILNSHVYQRRADVLVAGEPKRASLFAGPAPRRMSAEQVVDSMFAAVGKPFHVEEMSVDLDSQRSYESSLSMGVPQRAWQFASLSNERDRPALTLPAAQTIVNVLETFGWRASRPDPLSVRPVETTVLQPAVLANGVAAKRVSQLSDDSLVTELALEDKPLTEFIDAVHRAILTRPATSEERELFRELLADGYDSRRVDAPIVKPLPPKNTGVTWSNHLRPEASDRKLALAKELEAGDPPTKRLRPDWRERAEDLIWTLINSPEFVFVP